MNRLARRMLTVASIVGGGLLGAAPVATAAPPDPAPSPAPAPATTSDAPSPPAPAPAIRTGRAAAPDGRGGASGPPVTIPATPADGLVGSVRTGRAADLVPPTPVAGPSPTTVPTPSPSTPDPAPSSAPPRAVTRPASPVPATDHGSPTAAKPPAASVATGPPPPDPARHTAVAGDDLWSIAAARLAQVTGRPVASLSDADVAAYWAQVCDANRGRVRSGDLNLIFPGEEIALPPISS
jgi:hypothetical protein